MDEIIIAYPPAEDVIIATPQAAAIVVAGGAEAVIISAAGPQGPKGASGADTPWTDLTTDATLATSNRYRANSGVRLNLTLPASNFGDPDIFVQGYGGGGWKALGAGFISGGALTFSSYVESNDQYDAALFSPMGNGLWAVEPHGMLTSL